MLSTDVRQVYFKEVNFECSSENMDTSFLEHAKHCVGTNHRYGVLASSASMVISSIVLLAVTEGSAALSLSPRTAAEGNVDIKHAEHGDVIDLFIY